MRGSTVLGAAFGAPCNHFRPSTTPNCTETAPEGGTRILP
ncbi:TPA: hypothetical protein N0F65_009585 [Lagenidium giganteum]|uniref:Uncharacterized protein n=1 Tax=Lagenidium giganteum TaxID=4803 RepID=A0AAV2YKL9_9STRA|nr:TPA: hypothetical protein N0F65_009585 [Lagenidium giganteum]